MKFVLFILLSVASAGASVSNAVFGSGIRLTDISLQFAESPMNKAFLQNQAEGKTIAGEIAHYVGEKYGGGIVFYVYDNGKHGLIASTADQHAGVPWYNGLTRYTGTVADGVGAGAKNTKDIMAKLIHDDEHGFFAAKVCADYSVKSGGVVYGDWYLPSKFELNLLYQQKKLVGGFVNSNYWSSTEYKTNSVWIQYFGDGQQRVSNSEAYANNVRAIRAF